MLLNLLLPLAISIYPKIETYEIHSSQNFPISLLEGSLVFINTFSYTSEDFVFQFTKNKHLNSSIKNDDNITTSFLSPSPNVHFVFERFFCGDSLTIITNTKKMKENIKSVKNPFLKIRSRIIKDFNNTDSHNDQKENIDHSLILHFWRIPDGLCDINAYVIRSNNLMSIVPRSRSFSRFCIFSSINFSEKFNYKFNYHTTGSLLAKNTFKNREQLLKINDKLPIESSNILTLNSKNFTSNSSPITNNSFSNLSYSSLISIDQAISKNDDNINFILELFESGSTKSTLLHSNVDKKLTRPFLILGGYDDLNIGKLLLKFQSDDSECSATPVRKYLFGEKNNQIKSKFNHKHQLVSKNTTIQTDQNLSSIVKFKPEIDDNINEKSGNEENQSKLPNLSKFMKSKLLYYICKIKGKNLCDSCSKSNYFSFSYSTLFSPLLSLSTVSIELDGWKLIDVKCIEKGNDADAGFISLVVILVGMVIFVLINARKFVIFEMNGIQETNNEDNNIHLDIKDIESETEDERIEDYKTVNN